jgi:polar amino acid transport system substrate-binding protein
MGGPISMGFPCFYILPEKGYTFLMFRVRTVSMFAQKIAAWTLFVALSFSAGLSYAGQNIKVAAVKIPLMVETPEKGVFIDLLKEVSKRSGLTFDVAVYPGKRAHALFKKGEVDMLLPFPKGNRMQTGHLSDPIFVKRDFVFVKRGRPIPKSLSELRGKTLGITTHYRYKPALYDEASIQLDPGQSDIINVRKLNKGRLDGFLAEEFSGRSAIRESQVEDIVYDPDKPIFVYEAVVLFKGDAEGEDWMRLVNHALSNMRKDGTYMKLISFANNLKIN